MDHAIEEHICGSECLSLPGPPPDDPERDEADRLRYECYEEDPHMFGAVSRKNRDMDRATAEHICGLECLSPPEGPPPGDDDPNEAERLAGELPDPHIFPVDYDAVYESFLEPCYECAFYTDESAIDERMCRTCVREDRAGLA